MATYTKELLSDSTNGKGVKIAAIATPGTALHTAVAGETSLDELWIYAVNSDTTDRKLTLEWGGVASPDDSIEITVKAESGLVLIAPGLLLQNSLLLKAFCETADVVVIHGFVNRIAP